LALILVYLIHYPMSQLVLLLIILIFKLFFDFYLKPYKMKSLNILRILNDLILLAYSILLIIIRK
jgi:hypothetical protein